jgi:hypothetical protein
MSGSETIDNAAVDTVRLALRDQAREIEALTAELRQLRASATAAPPPARDYKLTLDEIRLTAAQHVPPGSTVAIASRGDDEILNVHALRTWHFPRRADGVWSGQYPADGAEAVSELHAVREQGATHLLLPWTAFWWLESYPAFAAHLDRDDALLHRNGVCAIYDIRPAAAVGVGSSGDHDVYRHTFELLDALTPQGAGALFVGTPSDVAVRASRTCTFLNINDAVPEGGLSALLAHHAASASYLVIPDVLLHRTSRVDQIRREAAARFARIVSRPGVCELFDLSMEAE